ncbi:MAG: hypothetical protein V3R80_09320, partial [Candidatus Tectomicrobia bacterium]
PTRSRRRRPHVGHGVRIADLGCMRARAATALHELQRGLPELQQLLAGHGRERLHGGHERRELLDFRRRRGLEGQQHQEPRCLPLPAATATGSQRRALARGAASACAPCGLRVAAGFPYGGGSLQGVPRQHRKQVITRGECASRRGTATV